jgi:hypothetical protein
MKAILRFNLEDPVDESRHNLCLKALELALVLNEMDNWLRGEIKYCDKNDYQVVRDKLHEFMVGHSIDLGELLQ